MGRRKDLFTLFVRKELTWRLLRWRPEFHMLIIVALFVSIASNLYAAWSTNHPRKWDCLVAAIAELIAAGMYLPLARESGTLWQEAYSRRAMRPRRAVEALIRLIDETSLRRIERGLFCAAIFAAFGLICVFPECLAWTRLLSITCLGCASHALLWSLTALGDMANRGIQPIANGVVSGLFYGLIAVSFGLIYTTYRFFHIAHSVMLAVGAYCLYALTTVLGFPLWLALPGALLFTCGLSVVLERGIFYRLRRANAILTVPLP